MIINSTIFAYSDSKIHKYEAVRKVQPLLFYKEISLSLSQSISIITFVSFNLTIVFRDFIIRCF